MEIIVYRERKDNPTYDNPIESVGQDSKSFSNLYDANKYFLSIRNEWRRRFDLQNDLTPTLQKFRSFRQNNFDSGEVEFYCKLIGCSCRCGILIRH
jgi:hypothetical protein